MKSTHVIAVLALGTLGWWNGTFSQTPPPPPRPKVTPKLEAVAETKLIMEGLAQANYKGLERLLGQRPQDQQAWVFARGQALLLAETANLLMLRPPKNQGQDLWFERAMEFRTQATQTAYWLAQKDFERSRAGLAGLANACNRCHQIFRVPVTIGGETRME